MTRRTVSGLCSVFDHKPSQVDCKVVWRGQRPCLIRGSRSHALGPAIICVAVTVFTTRRAASVLVMTLVYSQNRHSLK